MLWFTAGHVITIIIVIKGYFRVCEHRWLGTLIITTTTADRG